MLGTEFNEVVAQLEIGFLRESLCASRKFLAICFGESGDEFVSYGFFTFTMEQIVGLNKVLCFINLRPKRFEFWGMGYVIS